MRFLVRWAIRLFIILVVLIVALVLLKDTLLKAFAEHRIRAATGMEVRMDRFEMSLSSPRLTIENFKLYNPAEFGGAPFVDMPELHLECDPSALAMRKLHLKLLRLDLQEVNIVESKDGRTNVVWLMERLKQQQPGGARGESNQIGGFEFTGADVLNLSIGKVKYSSLKKPGKGTEFEVGLKNEMLTHVKSMDDLSGLLLKVLFRRGLSILTGGGGTTLGLAPGTRAGRSAHPAATNSAPARPRSPGPAAGSPR